MQNCYACMMLAGISCQGLQMLPNIADAFVVRIMKKILVSN